MKKARIKKARSTPSEKLSKSSSRKLPREEQCKIAPIEQPLGEERTREIREAFCRARYGEDVELPLFWVIEDLFRSTERARLSNLAPKDAPSQKTVIEWDRRQPTTKLDRLPGALLYDWVTIAIRKRDAKFFDEIARILRERIITHREFGSAFSSPDEHILLAYIELKEVGKEPTKKQIREKAKTNWAMWKIIKTGPLPFNGVIPSEQAVSIAKEKLPTVDWTLALRRCGLGNLPNDKSGRPRSRVRK